MGKKRTIMVKYLRTERFTNRNVDIKVELYEMDMAIVDITVKPAYWYYQRLCCRMNLPYGCRARFDYCKHEKQIEELLKCIGEGVYEKEHILSLSLLCCVAGESIFLLGPPGTAKSMVARRLKEVFSDARSFEYLMSRFSTPDELFGPIRENIDGVTLGNNLSAMLPTEVALLADVKSEGVFYKRYATKQLQLLSGKTPMIAAKKKDTERKDEPRLTEGPIIVSLDTSGSMGGEKEKVSKALLIHLMEIAKRKRRKCLLITFSISAKTLEVTHPKHWKKVASFLIEHFSGGTDGNQMLGYAIDALAEGAFEMADVLIVSDFEFDPPKDSLKKAIVKAQGQGTKFYGLRIGCGALYDSFYERSYERLLDKMWVVNV